MVEAHSEAALRARRNIVELLLAEAPNSRAIQDLAARVGVTRSRYPMRNNDCVLCGRCVRVCGEVWQSNSLGFVGRGGDRRVALPFDKRPDLCKRCNNCIEVCPMTITPCPGPMTEGGHLRVLRIADDHGREHPRHLRHVRAGQRLPVRPVAVDCGLRRPHTREGVRGESTATQRE